MSNEIPSGTYECGLCHGTFPFGRSVEEEMAEMERDFGKVAEEDRVRVCDDCYQKIRPDKNPSQYDAWKRRNASENNHWRKPGQFLLDALKNNREQPVSKECFEHGEKLKAARIAAGKTLCDVSSETCKDLVYASRIERGVIHNLHISIEMWIK